MRKGEELSSLISETLEDVDNIVRYGFRQTEGGKKFVFVPVEWLLGLQMRLSAMEQAGFAVQQADLLKED